MCSVVNVFIYSVKKNGVLTEISIKVGRNFSNSLIKQSAFAVS